VDVLARLGVTGLAATLLVVVFVCAIGLALGQLKVRGVGLGVAGVLFAGLLVGHLGFVPPAHALELLRDLGLLFFVYAIGAQLGPGFFQSLRHGGLRLNLLAVAVVVLGVAVAAGCALLLDLDVAGVVGVLAGATTNTPSLGAAQQVLDGLVGADDPRRGLASLGYAVAYPFGVAGIILSLVLLRVVFHIDPRAEEAAVQEERRHAHPPVERVSLRVENRNLQGLTVAAIPGIDALGVVISRILRHGQLAVESARADTVLSVGDTVLAVGAAKGLEALRIIVGRVADTDLMAVPAVVTFRRAVVTQKSAVNASLHDAEVALGGAVTFTRLRRGEVELTARPDLRLRFGDLVHMVGAPADLDRGAKWFGNSDKALATTEFLPIFLGLAAGIAAGTWAVSVSGLPAPLKLGLAGGPLLVAIVLGRLGRVGPVVWYMPGPVNVALRELGMALFLAAVGLTAGAHVLEALRSGAGPAWLAVGVAITLGPLLVVGAVGRIVLKLDYPTLSGVLAGAMTDPPALAFAQGLAGSEGPAVGYATVYPLTMVLRIVSAQVLVLLLSPG
jgi:putative transport protein